jgi:hypothetical protein
LQRFGEIADIAPRTHFKTLVAMLVDSRVEELIKSGAVAGGDGAPRRPIRFA